MRRMGLLVAAVAASLGTVVLVGCGASRPVHPFSASRVRATFAEHRLKPDLIFDASSATDRDIPRLAANDIFVRGSGRKRLVALEARTLREMRTLRTSMLIFPSGSPDGPIDVVVAPDPTRAQRIASTERRTDSRLHHQCVHELAQPHTTGSCIRGQIDQRGNVVAIFPATVHPRMREKVRSAIEAL
jgi:hypothetical protein